jgi:membrane fusion protein (multidrug efflux system)
MVTLRTLLGRLGKPRIPRSRWLAAGAIGLSALAGLGYGAYLWRYYATHVITDNAQVEGNVVPVSARVGGTVQAVLVDDHRKVRPGDVLVRLDPRDFQVRVAQARAAVAMAQSGERGASSSVPLTRDTAAGRVAQARAALRAAELAIESASRAADEARARLASKHAAAAVADAELQAARANVRKYELDFERMKRLLRERAISRQEFDGAEASYTMAQAQLAAAERRLGQALSEVEQGEVELKIKRGGVEQAQARSAEARAALMQMQASAQEILIKQADASSAAARLQEALANLEFAELQLEYAVIRAPVAGVVSRRSVQPGQVVQSGQPLLAIVPLDDIWVVANFKETQLTGVRPGQRVEIRVDTYPGRTFTGTVDSLSPATGARFSLLPPDNATGNFVKVVQRIPVKIHLERGTDPTQVLRPGMSVTATVVLKP